VSVAILEGIFAGDVKSHWFSVVRKAVAEHHESTTDPFSTMLKEADGKARQLEIEQEEQRVGLPWEQWFDVREFLSLAGTKVNVIQTGSLFHAFSMDGTVLLRSLVSLRNGGRAGDEKAYPRHRSASRYR
jgi:hypothetical protein